MEHECLRALVTAWALKVVLPNVPTYLLTYLLTNKSPETKN